MRELAVRNRRLGVILGLYLLPIHAAFASWGSYTSDNLTVLTDEREDRVFKILENLEIFRSAALQILNLPAEIQDERLMIFVFTDRRDFDEISGETNRIGYYRNSIYGPRILIHSDGDVRRIQRTLFYEYVRYLMDQHSTLNLPTWYAQGLATTLATTTFTRRSLRIGAQLVNRLFSPGVNVHGALSYEPTDTFWYTSWLMTHYFLLDSSENAARREQLLDYLRRFDAGQDSVAAFADSFGISPGDMEGELRRYRQRRMITELIFPRVPYEGSLSSRILEPGEVLYLLGDLAVEFSALEAAHERFDSFDELEDGSPFDTRVMASRAIAYMHEQRVDEGDALMEQLLARDAGYAAVLADIVHYEFDRYIHDGDSSNGNTLDHLNRAIEYGERATEIDATNLEAIYYLARAYEETGSVERAADMLRIAYDTDRSIPALNMALTRMLIELGDTDSALHMISRQFSATQEAGRRQFFRGLQQAVEDGSLDIEEIQSAH